MKHRLLATFEGRDLRAIARLVFAWPFFAATPRRVVVRDDGKRGGVEAWRDELIEAQEGSASFAAVGVGEGNACRVGVSAGYQVMALAPRAFENAEEVLALIEPLPFSVASFGTVFLKWGDIEHDSHGFANTHAPLGWGCAFKGAGHERLVSRRWLDYGPWRVLRGADVTLVQFHDLGLTDPAGALAQAMPGHERMGISEIGGFIQGPSSAGRGIKYAVADRLPEGLYDPRTRTLEVVVPPGRTISQGEMQDACAYRLNKRGDKEKPIERIAYVFIDEANAREHLHELWLRELEVWTVDGGEKRRLDLDYNPKPSPPAWVLDVEAREPRNR